MNILFIAGTLGQGGAENQLFLIARSLIDSGHSVTVYSLTNGEFWESRLKNVGVKVVNCPSHVKNRFERLKLIYRFSRMLKPELIYSIHFFTSFYAGFAGRALGIKSIGSIRSNGEEEKKNNGLLSYLNYNIPHAIVSNSQHGRDLAKKLLSLRSVKTGILNNAIDLNRFIFNEKVNNKSCLKLLFIGRLVKQKQPNYFINIVKSLHTSGIPVSAVIVGDGELRDQVINEIKHWNLEAVIDVIGNRPDIIPHLHNADALISCSLAEGTPNVIIEAMATGTPVFTLDYQGIHELIGLNNDRGFIYSKPEELVGLLSAYSKGNLNVKTKINNAKKFIELNYDLKKLPFRFEKLVNQLFPK